MDDTERVWTSVEKLLQFETVQSAVFNQMIVFVTSLSWISVDSHAINRHTFDEIHFVDDRSHLIDDTSGFLEGLKFLFVLVFEVLAHNIHQRGFLVHLVEEIS